MTKLRFSWNRDTALVLFFLILTLVLACLPTGYGNRVDEGASSCKGLVLDVDDSDVQTLGLVRTGEQQVKLEIEDGPFKGRVVSGTNPLLGQMDRDKLFAPGDKALVVLTTDADGEIIYVNPQEHYRLGLEFQLFAAFALLLAAFGGWTGVKALLSFLFAGLAIWKILIPLTLKGVDPVLISLAVVAFLCAAIIFLVAGPTRKGATAFLGAFLGVLTSCALAVYFVGELHLHGAVMPFAETLLYSGYGHLNLTKIFIAAVFLAASGAVMDLAMDVSASMSEVVESNPEISRGAAVMSGIRVGRAVVGTMTTTLLLAYSGGYITLLMAFMAQGIPLANTFNLVYVAAEVLKTLVGSFGLVMVAPFTALAGGFILVRNR